jgi:hypothetical protein
MLTQVNPCSPQVDRACFQLLILNSDKPVSNFAFKFDLRRYNEEARQEAKKRQQAKEAKAKAATDAKTKDAKVRRCRLTLSNQCRKRLELSS